MNTGEARPAKGS